MPHAPCPPPGPTQQEDAAYRAFTRRLLLVAAALLALVAGVNLVVDPYAVWRLVEIPGWTALKTRTSVGRVAKAHILRTLQPAAVLVGSSRTRIGFDPEHPWADPLQPRFSAAFGGATAYEMLRYFELATRSGPVRKAIVGIDFFMFNAHIRPRAGFDEARMGRLGLLRDLPDLLFADALKRSVATISHNRRFAATGAAPDVVQLPNGHAWWRPDRAYDHRAQFAASERGFAASLYFPDPERRFCLTDGEGRSTLRHLAALLRLARERGVEVTLIMTPAHARQFELAHRLGLWLMFEAWKRQVVATVQAEAPEVPVWDFTGFSSVSTEPLPREPGGRMRWYWDGSHFKAETGAMALDKIFGTRTAPEAVPDDFGVRLTPETLDAHLMAQRAARAAYAAAQPDVAADIARAVADTGGWGRAGLCRGP